jgi:YesN/AraC family two-component response regulator
LLKFISSSLAQQFFVKTAMNGEDAFREATAIIPDLVVTDLVIPRINGIELVKKIKQDERTSHIPVILITGKNDSLSRLEGLRAGVDDYLAKPFSTDELLLRIGNLIEQRKHLAKRYRERMANNPIPAKKLSFDEQFLQQVRATAESNLKDVTFSVSKMAEQMYVNRTYLLRKLKSLTGIAPNGYIKNLRMEKAAEMIRLKVNTIAQIGYAVGFNDQSYFTKCFKKHFGITPSEYAAKNAVP